MPYLPISVLIFFSGTLDAMQPSRTAGQSASRNKKAQPSGMMKVHNMIIEKCRPTTFTVRPQFGKCRWKQQTCNNRWKVIEKSGRSHLAPTVETVVDRWTGFCYIRLTFVYAWSNFSLTSNRILDWIINDLCICVSINVYVNTCHKDKIFSHCFRSSPLSSWTCSVSQRWRTYSAVIVRVWQPVL